MERIMGLDVGDKTIGVALSDPLKITAQGLKTIKRKNINDDIKEIEDIIQKYNVTKIVVGLPKNMNNTIGPQGEKVLNFVKKLKKRIDVDIILEDERLTTVAAEKMLIEGDVSRKNRKKVIDKVAATYILQTYLDRN
ncbi:putative Holliday junction resolvase [Keratinibaculum paraultunense]|uniref:Putative pre-16S rRNA nuclease n=1 Tax=Keratinibaculum paraultunense TaxID=1278232 RepID=A0A4R3L010_9FIRM|nr:Holliday junction resolvase RuvX [Keratinibaculum paraultunense]QQY80565.1 Holliday junction resolvase RuvX [Keratinibaculum paraultunense]TCS91292.1 putative Holliday junction resolvase [Keratinibaculum paraultunense]